MFPWQHLLVIMIIHESVFSIYLNPCLPLKFRLGNVMPCNFYHTFLAEMRFFQIMSYNKHDTDNNNNNNNNNRLNN